MSNNKILTETGTGELEIVKFEIDNQSYAINVIKTEAIIKLDEKISSVPMTDESFIGNMVYRGEVVPVIDLKKVITGKKSEDYKKLHGLSCEFNNNKAIFIIDKVQGIERIRWDNIREPEKISNNSLIVGNILLNNEIIQMIDFEKVFDDISSESIYNFNKKIDEKDRSDVKIVFAEDSNLLREILHKTLSKAGIVNIKQFKNGQDAMRYVKDDNNEVDIVITDIEMPKLDGHRLTRLLKEDAETKDIPVIIFSSLITEKLKHKGDSVGADYQISKPDVHKIIPIIDKELNL